MGVVSITLAGCASPSEPDGGDPTFVYSYFGQVPTSVWPRELPKDGSYQSITVAFVDNSSPSLYLYASNDGILTATVFDDSATSYENRGTYRIDRDVRSRYVSLRFETPDFAQLSSRFPMDEITKFPAEGKPSIEPTIDGISYVVEVFTGPERYVYARGQQDATAAKGVLLVEPLLVYAYEEFPEIRPIINGYAKTTLGRDIEWSGGAL